MVELGGLAFTPTRPAVRRTAASLAQRHAYCPSLYAGAFASLDGAVAAAGALSPAAGLWAVVQFGATPAEFTIRMQCAPLSCP